MVRFFVYVETWVESSTIATEEGCEGYAQKSVPFYGGSICAEKKSSDCQRRNRWAAGPSSGKSVKIIGRC